ncbi:oxygenase MpaB family protein [Actinomycetospora termitidis]|uniref:Oxygenase MpaB family protein n=1 Tax=Actinomycetospora termitidis TaxID=3053470 RepID=A0ABT7M3Y0_9PSEU|nr:oxygenase MpaB family protein [Actinomycetospora sp. Odt1-22]MDL5155376.1 oxygenase MpaB family protein [Actinomycetospora sp. Odt1-22]
MGTRRQQDYGFFGPESVTWKVWSYPTSIVLGFLRAVVIEELDPHLVASVDQSGQVKQRPKLRYDRTMQYFATVKFGDAESVLRASDTLMKIHSRAIGHDPVTGGTYDANDPASQLWIHLTAWHSILYTYEVFGPGKLTPDEETRYWEECARAAEFQTIDPADVPRDRDGIRAYFAAYRPRLVGSEVAQDMMDFLLDANTIVLPERMPAPLRLVFNAVARRAVIATMPRWMRKLGATGQSGFTDHVAIALTRPVVRAVAASKHVQLWALKLASPRTVPVIEPLLRGIEPVNPVVREPAEARAQYGVVDPRTQYAEILAARAVEAGPAPYPFHHREELVAFPA